MKRTLLLAVKLVCVCVLKRKATLGRDTGARTCVVKHGTACQEWPVLRQDAQTLLKIRNVMTRLPLSCIDCTDVPFNQSAKTLLLGRTTGGWTTGGWTSGWGTSPKTRRTGAGRIYTHAEHGKHTSFEFPSLRSMSALVYLPVLSFQQRQHRKRTDSSHC